jgi:hypothetical protein
MRAALLQQIDASIRWKKPGTILRSRYVVSLGDPSPSIDDGADESDTEKYLTISMAKPPNGVRRASRCRCSHDPDRAGGSDRGARPVAVPSSEFGELVEDPRLVALRPTPICGGKLGSDGLALSHRELYR